MGLPRLDARREAPRRGGLGRRAPRAPGADPLLCGTHACWPGCLGPRAQTPLSAARAHTRSRGFCARGPSHPGLRLFLIWGGGGCLRDYPIGAAAAAPRAVVAALDCVWASRAVVRVVPGPGQPFVRDSEGNGGQAGATVNGPRIPQRPQRRPWLRSRLGYGRTLGLRIRSRTPTRIAKGCQRLPMGPSRGLIRNAALPGQAWGGTGRFKLMATMGSV